MVENSLEAPGSIAELGGGEAVLLQIDGEHGELAGGQLAAVLVSRGRKEDAEAGLVVDGATRCIVPVTGHKFCFNSA
jgi:hypothetical protein